MFQKRNRRMRLEAGIQDKKVEVQDTTFLAAAGIRVQEI